MQQEVGNYEGDKKNIYVSISYRVNIMGYNLCFEPPTTSRTLQNSFALRIGVCKHATVLPPQPLTQEIVIYSATKRKQFSPVLGEM